MKGDPVPVALRGLWRRLSITTPEGATDTTTTVFWLQSARLFADIRIPADRPSGAGRTGFADFPDPDLLRLAAMSGFGGTLEVDRDICRWRRELDYSPPGGPPDEAYCRPDGELLIETGIHGVYEEIWRRETPIGAPVAGFRLEEDGRQPGRAGILVVAGAHFLLIQDRTDALPVSASLSALIEQDLAGDNRARAIDRLAMFIAHGEARPEPMITLSTYPWLEGEPLFAGCCLHFDETRGLLTVDGPGGTQRWRLEETNSASTAP